LYSTSRVSRVEKKFLHTPGDRDILVRSRGTRPFNMKPSRYAPKIGRDPGILRSSCIRRGREGRFARRAAKTRPALAPPSVARPARSEIFLPPAPSFRSRFIKICSFLSKSVSSKTVNFTKKHAELIAPSGRRQKMLGRGAGSKILTAWLAPEARLRIGDPFFLQPRVRLSRPEKSARNAEQPRPRLGPPRCACSRPSRGRATFRVARFRSSKFTMLR